MASSQTKLLTPPSWLAMAGVIWLFTGLAIVTAYRPYQVLLCLLVWIPAAFYAWHQRNELLRILSSYHGLAFIALSLWSAISLYWSETTEPFSSFREIMYSWLTIIPIILLSRIEPTALVQALRLCLPIASLIALAMLIDFFIVNGNSLTIRLEGRTLINNPLEAGRYFATLIIIFFTLSKKKSLKHPLYFAQLILMVSIILLSQSRSVWGAVFLALLAPSILDMNWRKLVPIASIAIAIGVLMLVAFPQALLERGLSGRPSLWISGLTSWAQNPLGGLGLGSDYIVMRADGQLFQHPHNLLIHTGITIGAIGVALFSILWLLCGWRLLKNRSEPLFSCAFSWWVFASITFWVEGYSLWNKPGDTWLQIWPPIAIALGMTNHRVHSKITMKHYHNLLDYFTDREGGFWKFRQIIYGVYSSLRTTNKIRTPEECDVLLIHPSEKSWKQGRKASFIHAMREEGLTVSETVTRSNRKVLKEKQLCRPSEPVPMALYLPAARAAYLLARFKPAIIITERNGWASSTFLRTLSSPETHTLHIAHGIISDQSSRLSFRDYDYYALFGVSSLEFLKKTPGFGHTKALLTGPYFSLPQKHQPDLKSKQILFLGAGPDEETSSDYRKICEIALDWLKNNPSWSLRIRRHPRGTGSPWDIFSQQHNNIAFCPVNETLDQSLKGITAAWCGYTNAILDCSVAGIPTIPLGQKSDFFQCSRFNIPQAGSIEELTEIMDSLEKNIDRWKLRLEEFSHFHIENISNPTENITATIKKIKTGSTSFLSYNID